MLQRVFPHYFIFHFITLPFGFPVGAEGDVPPRTHNRGLSPVILDSHIGHRCLANTRFDLHRLVAIPWRNLHHIQSNKTVEHQFLVEVGRMRLHLMFVLRSFPFITSHFSDFPVGGDRGIAPPAALTIGVC